MEIERKNQEETALGTSLILENYLREVHGNMFSLGASSSNEFQEYYNVDQFLGEGLISDWRIGAPPSSFDPLEALANGSMSAFDAGTHVSMNCVEERRRGIMELFQSRSAVNYPVRAVAGDIIFEQEHGHALSFGGPEPLSFVVPDEMSFVTGGDAVRGEVGVRRNSRPLRRSTARVEKRTNQTKGQWTLEEDKYVNIRFFFFFFPEVFSVAVVFDAYICLWSFLRVFFFFQDLQMIFFNTSAKYINMKILG